MISILVQRTVLFQDNLQGHFTDFKLVIPQQVSRRSLPTKAAESGLTVEGKVGLLNQIMDQLSHRYDLIAITNLPVIWSSGYGILSGHQTRPSGRRDRDIMVGHQMKLSEKLLMTAVT